MTLSLDAVAAIVRTVAGEHPSPVRLLGIASATGGTSRVELLVSVTDRHETPSLVMLNVSRTDSSQLEREIRVKLREAVSTRLR